MFVSNLKATFKFVAIVWLAISVAIVLNCFKNSDFSNILDPVYLLTLAPIIAASALVYTTLKNFYLNRYLSAIIFAFVNTVLFTLYYFVGHLLDNEELNMRFIATMSVISLITSIGLYLQLPWKQSDA